MTKHLSFNIWFVFSVLFGIQYGFMIFANHCFLFFIYVLHSIPTFFGIGVVSYFTHLFTTALKICHSVKNALASGLLSNDLLSSAFLTTCVVRFSASSWTQSAMVFLDKLIRKNLKIFIDFHLASTDLEMYHLKDTWSHVTWNSGLLLFFYLVACLASCLVPKYFCYASVLYQNCNFFSLN